MDNLASNGELATDTITMEKTEKANDDVMDTSATTSASELPSLDPSEKDTSNKTDELEGVKDVLVGEEKMPADEVTVGSDENLKDVSTNDANQNGLTMEVVTSDNADDAPTVEECMDEEKISNVPKNANETKKIKKNIRANKKGAIKKSTAIEDSGEISEEKKAAEENIGNSLSKDDKGRKLKKANEGTAGNTDSAGMKKSMLQKDETESPNVPKSLKRKKPISVHADEKAGISSNQQENDEDKETMEDEDVDNQEKVTRRKGKEESSEKAKTSGDTSDTVAEKAKKQEASRSGKTSDRLESKGMIFMCNSKTKKDCFHYRVFGLPESKKEIVSKIYKGMRLFLFDADLKLLHGIYKAAAPGGYNIERKAFNSSFPSQVRFSILTECGPLPLEEFKAAMRDNFYSKNKFNCELTAEQVKGLCKMFRATAKSSRHEETSHYYKRERREVYAPPLPPRALPKPIYVNEQYDSAMAVPMLSHPLSAYGQPILSDPYRRGGQLGHYEPYELQQPRAVGYGNTLYQSGRPVKYYRVSY